MSNVHLNQVVPISVDTDITLSGASVAQIIYRKPNGVRGAWNASINGDTLTYTTSTSDLDVLGNWQVQSYVIISGAVKKGRIRRMQVKAAL